MKKAFLIMSTGLMLYAAMPVQAHEGEPHSGGTDHAHENTVIHDLAAQITDNADALKVIQDGIAFMNDIMTSEQTDLFNNGPVMDKLHDVTVHIEESAKFIEEHAALMPEAQKTRLSSAIKQLTKSVTDFHTATHDRNLENSMAELKKSQGALKLVEASLK